jgi:O-antigen ligase
MNNDNNNNAGCVPYKPKLRTFLEFLLVGFFVSLVFVHYVVPKPFRIYYLVVGFLFFAPICFSSILEKRSHLWSIFSRFFVFYLLFVAFFCLRTHFSEYRGNIYFKKVLLSFLLYAPYVVVGVYLSFHKKWVLEWLGLIFLCFLMPVARIVCAPSYVQGGVLLGTRYTHQGLGFILGISGLSVCCLLGGFLFVNKGEKCRKAIGFGLMLFLYWVVYIIMDKIGGRAAFGGYILGGVILLFYGLVSLRVSVLLKMMLLIILSLILIFSIKGERKSSIRIKEIFQKSVRIKQIGKTRFVNDPSCRKTLFSQALKLWVSSPKSFFVGVGMGGFQWHYEYLPDQPGMYPHNFILELLCETGILGTLLFAGMLFWPYRKAKELTIYGCSQGDILLYPLLAFQFFVLMFTGALVSLHIFFALFFASLPCPSQKEIEWI